MPLPACGFKSLATWGGSDGRLGLMGKWNSDKFHLQFQGKRARPWLLRRQTGSALGQLFFRVVFPSRATSNRGQLCLDAMLSHGGFSAYQMAFGSNPVDL